jgi:hypothetical protein
MKLYVCGPMSNLPEKNFPAFNKAAEQLRAIGFEVVNPVDLNPDPDASWQECMKVDIREMLLCDGLAWLPGTRYSNGATIERELARTLGLECLPLQAWLFRKGLHREVGS